MGNIIVKLDLLTLEVDQGIDDIQSVAVFCCDIQPSDLIIRCDVIAISGTVDDPMATKLTNGRIRVNVGHSKGSTGYNKLRPVS